MDKIFLFGIVFIVALGFFVFAQTITNSFVVNAYYCSETDGGLNYGTFGSVNGGFWWTTGNNTNSTIFGTFDDTCLDNVTLFEGVCGSSISPSYNGLAGAVYVTCLNRCFNGACDPSPVLTGIFPSAMIVNTSESFDFEGYNFDSPGAVLESCNPNCTTLKNHKVMSQNLIRLNYTQSKNGTYQLRVRNLDNLTSSFLNLTVLNSGVDLVIMGLNLSYVVNGTINATTYSYGLTINATVKNKGNTVAGASTISFFYSMVWGQHNVAIPPIGPGQSVVVSAGPLSAFSGSINISAQADSFNTITEYNEYNNMFSTMAYLP